MNWRAYPPHMELVFKKKTSQTRSKEKYSFFLYTVIREKNFISRTLATIGLGLWLLVLSLQCIHEWTHHHSHHSEGSFQCDHHHAHSSVPSSTDAGISMTDACLICDWDWLPFESVQPIDSHNLNPLWQQRFRIGLVNTGHKSKHRNQTKSHRGPPKRG